MSHTYETQEICCFLADVKIILLSFFYLSYCLKVAKDAKAFLSRCSELLGPGSRRESFFLNPQDSLDSNNGSTYINASSLAASAALPPGTGNEQEMTAGQTLLQSIGAGVVGAASNFSTITPPRYRKSFLRPYQHF